ncbi:hypothetical protein MMC25_000962 [Agyrium rufum]|nr:hypothetical protein [Agyrium rufum]
MKASAITTLLAALGLTRAAVMRKRTSNSFGGANNWHIHAASNSTITSWVQQVDSLGAKVVRLWVTGISSGCLESISVNSITDIETSLGKHNNASLIAIDNVLAQLTAAGIKAIISPHNANDLSGSNCDAYCHAYGCDGFYTQAKAASDYDARLQYILDFVSPHFGKPWSQLSEAILAFDVENEPMIACNDVAKNGDPQGWLCGRAKTIAGLTNGSGVKVATGGIAGSQYYGSTSAGNNLYNLASFATQCAAVDIISMHSYLTASQWSAFIPSSLNQTNGKHLMVEESGVGSDASKYGQSSIPDSEFDGITNLFTSNGVPFVYWEAIAGPDETQSCGGQGSCCQKSLDGYGIGPGSKKTDLGGAIGKADQSPAAQDWTGYIY